MPRRVLVVEDEPDLREMVALVLRRGGYDVHTAADGTSGLALAQTLRPHAVLLDLMVPGLHGYEVIQRLRASGPLQDVPIVVVSAKPYAADQRKALTMGASAFLPKPFDPAQLLATVRRQLARTRVRFWGVRGSIAVPGPDTLRYGGNTPCISVEHDETMLIFDGGTGLRPLGLHLQRSANGNPLDVHMFISHTHWDHIQGIPFFVPALVKGNTVHFYGPPSVDKPLERVLRGQMSPEYFPVALGDMAAEIHVVELRGEAIRVGPFEVTYVYVNHPGVTLGYRVTCGGRTLVYAPDNEPYRHLIARQPGDEGELLAFGERLDETLIQLFSKADLVIADSQYTPLEYQHKMGWGHSNYLDTVEVALRAGSKRLALFSHDPMHDDTVIDKKLKDCCDLVQRRGASLEVLAATENAALDLVEAAPIDLSITSI